MVKNKFPLPTGPLTAVFQIEVGGLYVRGDQLGSRLETERDGQKVSIEIPGRDQAQMGQDGISGWRGDPDDPNALFVVEIVRVGVSLRDTVGPGADLRDLLKRAEPPARHSVRALLNWARIRDRQPWLAPPHVEIALAGASWVENETGERSQGIGRVQMVIPILADEDAPSGDLSEALNDQELDESGSLLAEARWAVWPDRDADTKRAVLLAAIALEVKASETLRAMADDRTRPLVDLLLAEEPSVNKMLNKIAPAVGGNSLKEHDGRLNKAVGELFELRNDVAHRGQAPEAGDALSAVKAAEDAFSWLNGRAQAGTPQP